MRNMSVAYTTEQIENESKTITRRNGWWFLKPGDIVMTCKKCMGFKKGEKIQKIKPIRIISTRKERLSDITQDDVVKEGFPDMSVDEFIDMYKKIGHYKYVNPDSIPVNRIEFCYVKEQGDERVY